MGEPILLYGRGRLGDGDQAVRAVVYAGVGGECSCDNTFWNRAVRLG